MKKIIQIVTFCFILFQIVDSQALPQKTNPVDNIAAMIRAGNSKELAKYFGPTVEIILPGTDGAFSKAQAEMIIKDFFAKSPPVSFTVNQNRNSAGGAQFIIGSYKSKTEKLNLYMLLKTVGGQLLIQQIHFETD